MNSTATKSARSVPSRANETSPASKTQGLLFSEPAIAETGIWCELTEGIDPAHWAYLCRHLGSLSPRQFNRVAKKLLPNPDGLLARLKRMFTPDQTPDTGTPVLSLGPSGIHGHYQKEVYPGAQRA